MKNLLICELCGDEFDNSDKNSDPVAPLCRKCGKSEDYEPNYIREEVNEESAAIENTYYNTHDSFFAHPHP